MDIIFLRGLQIETVIGIYDWERTIRQTVEIDLELGTDIRRAAASDHIQHTLDYKAIADRLREFVGASEFFLIETLAERVADLLLAEFRVSWLRLTVTKIGALGAALRVGLIIERSATRSDA